MQTTSPWMSFSQTELCGGLGGGSPVQELAVFAGWKYAAGSPVRRRDVRTAVDWDGSDPTQVQPDVLSAGWYPGLITLGAEGGSGPGFPQFAAWNQIPNEDDPNEPPTDTRSGVGLTMAGIAAGDRPQAYLRFSEPMRAVYVELDFPPVAKGGSLNCGVRFEHRRDLPGGGEEWITLASLKPGSVAGGVVLDLGAASTAAVAAGLSVSDLGIDRVTFDPPEQDGALIRRTRLVQVAWQTLACAQAASAFERPYRLIAAGAVVEDHGVPTQPPEFGASVLGAMWPSTDYRFRVNSAGMIAGSYFASPSSSGLGGGVRPALWYRTATGQWERFDLAPEANESGVDSFACSLTEPFLDESGEWVVIVGGARRQACAFSADLGCGKPHAAMWRVRLQGQPFHSQVAVLDVEELSVQRPCAESLVDFSVVRDLRLDPVDGGRARALGCGSVGMWCGWPDSPKPMDFAAAFVPSELPSYDLQAKIVHFGKPFVCQAGEGSGPLQGAPGEPPDRWAQSTATSWVRGAPGYWGYSVVGHMEDHLRCSEDIDAGCDFYRTAMQWDWSAWCWTASAEAPDPRLYPRARGAPFGSTRPFDSESGGTSPRQKFSSESAMRRTLDMPGAGELTAVFAAGWLVDGCASLTECGCDWKAAAFEYVDGPGDCWTDTTTPCPEGASSSGQSGTATSWLPSTGAADCLRVVNLHDVIWTAGGAGDTLQLTPVSKAAAIVAPEDATATNLRLVLGAAFQFTQNGYAPALSTGRGILWRGTSPSMQPSPRLPNDEWCGRKLDQMVATVLIPGVAVETWEQLEAFWPAGLKQAIVSGQDMTPDGRVACVANLFPSAPYQVCLLVPVADLDGSGVVDGTDLGLLLGSWGSGPHAADLDGSGVVDGTDLGLLLGSWGSQPVDFSCGATSLITPDLDIVVASSAVAGFQSLDELKGQMEAMEPSEAEFLAEFIAAGVAIRRAEGGAP